MPVLLEFLGHYCILSTAYDFCFRKKLAPVRLKVVAAVRALRQPRPNTNGRTHDLPLRQPTTISLVKREKSMFYRYSTFKCQNTGKESPDLLKWDYVNSIQQIYYCRSKKTRVWHFGPNRSEAEHFFRSYDLGLEIFLSNSSQFRVNKCSESFISMNLKLAQRNVPQHIYSSNRIFF